MELPCGHEPFEFANALIHSRQNVSPRRLQEPGPSLRQLQVILNAAAAAPDHGQLLPWRFVIVPAGRRADLAEVFAQALLERDPDAGTEQVESAREKAYRAPFLMLAIAKLADREIHSMGAGQAHGALHPAATGTPVGDGERWVSLGCAIQNMLLSAHAAGFGTGLTSGQAMASSHLRSLFGLQANEQAVCCINIGTASKRKPPRIRPDVARYVATL